MNLRAATGLLLLGASCGSGRPPLDLVTPSTPTRSVPQARPAPVRFDLQPGAPASTLLPVPADLANQRPEARLLITEAETVELVSIVAGRPYLASSVTLPGTVTQRRWLGDALFVSFTDDHARTGVARLSDDRVEILILPASKLWEVPPSGPITERPGWSDLVVGSNRVWLGLCQYGAHYDAAYCQDWSYVEIWPTAKSPKVVHHAPPSEPTEAPVSDVQAPEGFSLRRNKLPPVENTMVDPAKRWSLGCDGDGTSLTWPADARGSFIGVTGTRWVSTAPPLLMVDYQFAGLDVASASVLLQACVEPPLIEKVTGFEAGPVGLWLIRGDDLPWSLYRAGSLVARFAPDAAVSFVPESRAERRAQTSASAPAIAPSTITPNHP